MGQGEDGRSWPRERAYRAGHGTALGTRNRNRRGHFSIEAGAGLDRAWRIRADSGTGSRGGTDRAELAEGGGSDSGGQAAGKDRVLQSGDGANQVRRKLR